MAIRGIHHVALHTPNFERMLRFYREGLGFEPTGPELKWQNDAAIDAMIDVPDSAARMVMLTAGNVYLELFEYSQPPPRQSEPLRPHDHGYTHFCLDTDDARGDYERLIAAGMSFAQPLTEGGGVITVYGKDPDGNIIELQQICADLPFDFTRLPLVCLDQGQQ